MKDAKTLIELLTSVHEQDDLSRSFRVILMVAFLGSKLDLDLLKVLKMLLIYELTEKEDALKEWKDLWLEFEQNETFEAQFAQQISKIDMLLQAVEDRKNGHEISLEPLFEDVRFNLKTGELKKFCSQLWVHVNANLCSAGPTLLGQLPRV